MKNNFILILLFVLFGVVNNAVAQQPEAALKIGDQLPDFIISKLLNAGTDRVSTEENTGSFKDRLLIIDFWATSCSGCVAALPKMEALQKQFGNKIKVLPVTYEERALVTGFWKKNKYTKVLALPTVVEDNKYKAFFPHEAIPHEVWVYKGEVIGITDADYVDAYNIQQVLDGKTPNWPVKNDYYFYDASKQPLFTPDEKQEHMNSIHTYAAIRGYMEKDGASAAGVFGNTGTVRDSVKKTIRTWFINQSIFSSYATNWNAIVSLKDLVKPSSSIDPNQIVWEVKDPKKYMSQSTLTPDFKTGYRGYWMRENAICFESVKRDTGQTNKDISRGIIADLDSLLGLKVRWEKRKEKVFVLVSTGKKTVISPAQAKANEDVVNSVDELVYKLNRLAKNPYVFNETKGEEKLDLTINSWTDLSAIGKALAPYGLLLKEEERLVDKFILSERKKI
ncbi:TlpA family protein disulfide reductase [Pedobacter hiemivivus]|nr:redoxin family protein [Pedobacter hiemivivus]